MNNHYQHRLETSVPWGFIKSRHMSSYASNRPKKKPSRMAQWLWRRVSGSAHETTRTQHQAEGIWGLSNIPSSRIGGLRCACAELARACARTVWLTMVFAQAYHTIKTNTMSVFEPLRQPCAVLARSLRAQGFWQIMLYLVFGNLKL